MFRGARAALSSHRGWDAGARAVARRLAVAFDVPLLATATSRLLVDHNRSPGHPALWSTCSQALTAAERSRVLDRYYWPHREAVTERIAATIGHGRRAVHVAVHSFTPVLDGQVRRADVGLLYDPARPGEPVFARRWQAALSGAAPGLRVRRNYPYRGCADGLTTWLRRRHAPGDYLGIELELNQRLLASPDGVRKLARLLAGALALALESTVTQSSGQDTNEAPIAASQTAGSTRASSRGT